MTVGHVVVVCGAAGWTIVKSSPGDGSGQRAIWSIKSGGGGGDNDGC